MAGARRVGARGARASMFASGGTAAPDITLYQFQTCPFCSKVRTYLDFKRIPFEIVEVNPITKSEIKWSESYKKVPIATVNGEQINESANIIRHVASLIGDDQANDDSVSQWSDWLDQKLVKTLPPNIYRTPSEALQATGTIAKTGNYDIWQKISSEYLGAAAMFFISKKMRDKYGIEKGKEREALYTEVNRWVEGLDGKPFMGGDRPNMADLEVFGVLESVAGMDASKDMLANTQIKEWYNRMKAETGRT
eukprot:CAMPEP_0184490130 /NCGR_PEP_ID=MMETSP0113_2-20130426/17196_1 /TAXON_ID=91329 /ORGANISM="Norrisiella sphaerica, Strain BC52" /LENGTH=250 /DNA_ID=CAMNT_0026873889 /DNA_START=194 /DNA_END=946 /DNA_ORIENTATION=-